MIIIVIQWIAIGVYAASGAMAAERARLDLFGAAVVGMTTALGGGVIRDVMLGIHPPTVLKNWPFLVVAASVSLAMFWLNPRLTRLRQAMLVADAVGLGLFTTASTATALATGVPGYDAWLIGVVGGIGGGVMRDLLVGTIPLVLRREVYAVAAMAGGVVVVAGDHLGLPAGLVSLFGSAVCVAIRLLAIWRHWNEPDSDGRPPAASQ